jgi:hypothetical protein
MRGRYVIIAILYMLLFIWPFFVFPHEYAVKAFFLIAYINDLILVIPFLTWCLFNSYYIKKYKKSNNFEKTNKHVAIILVTAYIKRYDLIHLLPFYGSGIFFLIKKLKNNDINYKVYDHADLKTLKKLVYNKNCYGIYIIGHGRRGCIKISKKEVYVYSNFKNAPKKEFIVQLHCNDGWRKSLGDYIAFDKNKSSVENFKRNLFDNLFYFLKYYFKNTY